MNKILSVLVTVMFLGLMSHAQIPDGSVAPDFTITDINQQTHNLQSYLDDGYSVVIDMSATWCPPCWSYHESGALEELWANHGPAGQPGVSANTTDDVIVIFIESDPTTTEDDLNGTGANTQGNWVAGVDFIMADDDGPANSYSLTAYPTIFTVCSNGYLIESGPRPASDHYDLIQLCSAPSNAAISSYTGEAEPDNCDDDEFNVSVDVINVSGEPISSMNLVVNDANGNQITSEDYSGNLTTFGTTSIDFGALTIESSPIEILITTDDADNSDNSIQQAISFEVGNTDATVTVDLLTDNYGDEIYMEIVDDNGNVIWQEGNENVQGNFNTGQFPPAADPTDPLGNNQNYSWDVNLSSTGCYTFMIYDYYGDGLGASTNTQGGVDGEYSIKNNQGVVIGNMNSVVFGSASNLFENGTSGTSTITDLTRYDLSIFPNPVSSKANIQFNLTESATVNVTLVNVLGETVNTNAYQLGSGAQNVNFNVTDVTAGVYFIQLDINGQIITQKITVVK